MLIESEQQKKDRMIKELNEKGNIYTQALKKCRRTSYSRSDEHKIREMEIRQDK